MQFFWCETFIKNCRINRIEELILFHDSDMYDYSFQFPAFIILPFFNPSTNIFLQCCQGIKLYFSSESYLK